jgi:Putative peptidoglycan binding domain
MADPSTLLFVTCVSCAPPPPIQTPQPIAASNQPSKPTLPQGQLGSMPKPTAPQSLASPNWSTSTAQTTGLMLGLNSQGAAVIQLQTQLRQLGYYKGPIDGFYSMLTQAAVIKFQQAKRLAPDGIVGSKTWTSLRQLLLKPAVAPSNPTRNSTQASPQQAAEVDAALFDIPFDVTFDIPFDIQAQYLLYLGLPVIYLGGWVIIFKDMAKEVRGCKFASSSCPSKDFEAAAKRIAHATSSGQKVPMVLKYSVQDSVQNSMQDSSVAYRNPLPNQPVSSPASAPQLEVSLPAAQAAQAVQSKDSSVESEHQNLAVVLANEGLIHPLHNLFVGLEKPKQQNIAMKRYAIPLASAKATAKATAKAKAKLEVVSTHEEETTVATLPLPSSNQTYTYALIDDAAGLFVLRGNQLRVINRLLQSCRFNERRVTVRRTNANGKSVDKSFQIEIQKIKQSIQPELALVGAAG